MWNVQCVASLRGKLGDGVHQTFFFQTFQIETVIFKQKNEIFRILLNALQNQRCLQN